MRLIEARLLVQNRHLAAILLVTPDPNIQYLAQVPELSFAALAVTKESAVLYVPDMEYQKAREHAKVTVKSFKGKLSDQLKGLKGKKVGINESSVTVATLKRLRKVLRLKTVDIGSELMKLRSIKTNNELKKIAKACQLTDEIFSKLIKRFKSFKSESDVAAFILNETAKLGCEPAFKPIVASGSGASQPHYELKNIPLKKGFCIIDMGIKYEGYCADMSRTIYIGKPSGGDILLYNLVLSAQRRGVSKSLPQAKVRSIHQIVSKALHPYEKKFIHSTGHGVGVEIHESPSISPKSNETLQEGMAITIEPGIYLKDKGIRIEDTIIVGKKPKILTQSSKKLIQV